MWRARYEGDSTPWEVNSRWYEVHNEERYSDDDVCTADEYTKLNRK